MRIESMNDSKVVEAESLMTPRGRHSQGKALLYSRREVDWAIAHHYPIDYVLATEECDVSAPLYLCTEGILKKITGSSYGVPLLAVITLEKEEWTPTDPLLIVFDREPSYPAMGAMIRIASAFGLHQFLSTRSGRELWQKKTIDASEGTVFEAKHRAFASPEETLAYLQANNYQIAVPTLEAGAIPAINLVARGKIALLFHPCAQEISPIFLEAADLQIQIEKDLSLELQINNLIADLLRKAHA